MLRSKSFTDHTSNTILTKSDKKTYKLKTPNSVENLPLNNFFMSKGNVLKWVILKMKSR